MRAKTILESLHGHRILVVGDVMIDRYLNGDVSRISPEAPVPVVRYRYSENRLGGAANVALNLASLGAEAILCSVCGADSDGDIFCDMLPSCKLSTAGILRSTERCTTVKTRVLSNMHQMLRIDQEDTHELSPTEETDLLARIQKLLDTTVIHGVILQDYNKGVMTANLIKSVLEMTSSRGIPSAVDPKKSNFFAYQGVDLFKPNLKEIRDSSPFPIEPVLESLDKADHFIRERIKNRITMITLSEKGLYLNDGKGGRIFSTIPRTIADVSGAGDTVISIASLALAAQLPLEIIAQLSNLAGGQVCEMLGVVPVQVDLLEKELDISLNAKS